MLVLGNFALHPVPDVYSKGNLVVLCAQRCNISMHNIGPRWKCPSIKGQPEELLWIIIIPWEFSGLLRTFDTDHSSICNVGVGQEKTFKLGRWN